MSNQQYSIALVLFALAIGTSQAITKKSDENSGMVNQPVYQASSSNNQFSISGQYSQGHENSGPNNLKTGSQSNLYYYYYPVQDNKPKDGQYHSGSSPMNHQTSDSVENSPMDAAASGSEISYSTPELNHEYSSQSQGFDQQTLNNLASQFQQQYFNNPSNNYEGQSMGYGPQSEASAHMPSQVHPGYGPNGNFAFAQGAPYGQHGFGFGGGAGAIQPQSTEVSGIASGLKKYGLTSILMPVLAIAGLSLLLPTVTSLGTTTTKTKRSIEDSPFSSYIEKMDAYYKMYNKALEKEECMNKMICELG